MVISVPITLFISNIKYASTIPMVSIPGCQATAQNANHNSYFLSIKLQRFFKIKNARLFLTVWDLEQNE